MRSFAGEGKLRARAIKFGAPFDELRDVLGAFFDEKRHGFGTAEAITGVDGVLFVEADLVFVAEGYGNAALRPSSGGIAEIGFGENQDAAGAAEFNGGAQASDARTYHGVVGVVSSG